LAKNLKFYLLFLPLFFIKLRICKIWYFKFEPQTLKFKNLRVRHTRLSYINLKRTLFVEIFRIKKPSVKVKISNLINYSTICYQIRWGSTIFISPSCQLQFMHSFFSTFFKWMPFIYRRIVAFNYAMVC
jgi:hypothetical protein